MAKVYLMILVAKFCNVHRLVVEGENKQIMEGLEKRNGCPNSSLEPIFDQILRVTESFIVFKSV